MFGSRSNPANAYSRVGLETSVQGASPHQLIVLLFEGARQAVVIARAGVDAGDIAQQGAAITKAIDIIANGLKASLDQQQGGELAIRLAALYDYMVSRLLWANMKNDIPTMDEVHGLLSEIHDAWNQIEPGKQQTR